MTEREVEDDQRTCASGSFALDRNHLLQRDSAAGASCLRFRHGDAMPSPPPDNHASLLREQIRHAGVVTGEARWLLQLAVGSFLIGLAFFAGLIAVILAVSAERHIVVVVGAAPFLLLIVGFPCWCLGTWIALPLPAAPRPAPGGERSRARCSAVSLREGAGSRGAAGDRGPWLRRIVRMLQR
jgi:hypothetical protein